MSTQQLISKYWRPDIALLFGAMALCAGIFGINTITLSNLREEMLRTVEANTQSQAVVLAEEGDRSLKVLDMALAAIADTIGISDEPLERRLAGHDTHDWLREKAAGIPHADAIFLIGAHGKLVNFTRHWPTAVTDVANRDYFVALKGNASLKTFISEAVQDGGTGTRTIYLARRLNAQNGDFLGLVLGAMTVDHFERFFRSVALLDGSAITLVRNDGMLLARYPNSNQVGKIIPVAAPIEVTTGKARHVKSPIDRELRIVSVKSLASFPLRVAVSQTEASALRSWRVLADQSTTMAFVKTFFVLLMAWAACRWWEKQRSLTQAWSLQNLRFDTALANMVQGLAMFDADQRLVIANEQYAQLYGLTLEQVKPGTTIHELLAHRHALGAFGNINFESFARDWIIEFSKAATRVQQLADGRIISIVRKPMANGGLVSTTEDITERCRSEARIVHMARHDVLTDLPNRALLGEQLEKALARVNGGEKLALHFIDLDHFKNANDTLGHAVGDKLLRAVADRLRQIALGSETIARLGGDEFAIVQLNFEGLEEVVHLAQALIATISEPYDIDGHQIVVGASIGIALASTDGDTPDQLLRNADLALYRAKENGRGCHHFFDRSLDQRMQTRRALEADLRKAVAGGQFELYYQPIVLVDKTEIIGMEALIRWHHPDRGVISPADFIALAEETGLIVPMGEWVIRQACATAARWPNRVKVAVNLSPAQFRRPGLIQTVANALAAAQLAPHRLELEITETIILEASESTISTLNHLRALGVRIALDDFGTGYSSLSYLQSFPLDRIKIDRSFIRDIDTARSSADIVQAMVTLSRALDLSITAEGVETESQLAVLRDIGCTEAQGYLFSRPLPAEDIERLILATDEGDEQAA